MTDGESPGKPAQTREERLAAKLRENLHRRKARSRQSAPTAAAGENNPALSKSPPNS